MSKDSQHICEEPGCNRPVTRKYNSTIYNKYCPSHTLKRNIDKAKQHEKKESTGNRSNRSRKGKKSFNLYTTTAWKWFRKYVLLSYADNNGIVQCCTSGIYMSITDKKCHLGHYIKILDGTKSHYSVAFEFCNVGPQSLSENTYHGGRPDVMKEWLIKEHGKEAIEELNIKKNNICHLDKFTLDIIAKEYKNKFKQLLTERNIEDPWKKKK